jgi:hypothetical protein
MLETLAPAVATQVAGPDVVLGVPTRFASGFVRSSPSATFIGRRAYGHPGAGASVAYADPSTGLCLAYVTIRLSRYLSDDPRAVALSRALGRSLP